MKSQENQNKSEINVNVSGSETDTKYHHFSNPTDLKFYFTEFENNSQRRLYREDPLPKEEDVDEIYQRQTDKLRKTKHFALDNPQSRMDNLVPNKMEQTGQFSSESDNQKVLSDPETDLKLNFQKAENYKIFVNISSDLPYPFWVNGNSIKTASHSNKLLKPDWKNLRLVDKSDRNDGEFKNKIFRFSFPAFPIFVKLGNVAKLVTNSYKKKLSTLLRITRRYPPVTPKQLLMVTSLLASMLLLVFL